MTRLIGRLALALAGLGVGVLGAELLARQLYEPPHGSVLLDPTPALSCYELDGDMGYVPRPGVCGRNAHGFLDPSDELAVAPGEQRVVVLGDSIADQDYFPKMLEEVLDTRLPGGADVLNLGVSGYGTVDEARYLATWGERLSPDLVVLQFCLNDFGITPLYVERDGQLQEVRVEYRASVGPSAWLFGRSALYRAWALRKLAGEVVVPKDAVDLGLAALADIAEPVEALDARLLVAPSPELLVRGTWPKLQAETYDTVKRATAELGVPTLDLAPVFEAAGPDELMLVKARDAMLQRETTLAGLPDQAPLMVVLERIMESSQPPEAHPSDRTHPNPIGHALATQAMVERILDPADPLLDHP